MAKIRDKIWIWGQTPGVHHRLQPEARWNLPGENKMTPLEGCEFFGIDKCCRVVMWNDPAPPYDNAAEELSSLSQVVWSVVGDGGSDRTDSELGELDEVIRIANKYPNIVGGVLDDFFLPRRMEVFKPEHLAKMRHKLHTDADRELDLRVVVYTHEIKPEIAPYLKECDVITYWTWIGSHLENFDEYFETLKSYAPDKRFMVGLYMWNYGECRPYTRAQMDFQFQKYFDLLMNKTIDGVIICSNCIADVGIEAVEWTKNWLNQIGDAEII